jgi:hypothetical protein
MDQESHRSSHHSIGRPMPVPSPPRRRLIGLTLGSIVATPGALRAMEAVRQQPMDLLVRHAAGDWGEVGEEDWASNDRAVTHGGRLLSAYRLADDTKLWVITEADRSVTTILQPEEY